MIDLDLNRMETLAAAATAGPWSITLGDAYYVETHDLVVCTVNDTGPDAAADAAFIEASREAIPALVAEVKRLRSTMEDMARVMESMIALMERSVPLCACKDIATYTDHSRTRHACDRHRDDDGWVELSWAEAARKAAQVLSEVEGD